MHKFQNLKKSAFLGSFGDLKMALDTKAFAIAGGLIWAACMFVMALISNGASGYGIGFVYAIGSLYVGYQPGIIGAIIGAIYGFIDAGIGCFVFAWLYNKAEAKH